MMTGDLDTTVLHVSSYPDMKGGIADYMGLLRDELPDRHTVLSFRDTDADIPLLDRGRLRSFITGFRSIRTESPDVVHIQHELNLYGRINFLVLAALLLLWKPFTDTRFVTTLHTYERYRFSLQPKALLRFVGYRMVTFPLLFAYSDRVIVHNDVIAQQIDRSDVRVIPHGVKRIGHQDPVRQEYGISSEETMLLGIGFIAPGKGFETAIRAMPELPEEYRLLITGSTAPTAEDTSADYIEQLRELVAAEGVGDRVVFREEFVPEERVDALLADTDVAAFPYPESSQSGMMHRAIGAGTPIVCSDLDVFEDLLGDAARYFPAGNPEALATAVQADPLGPDRLDELRAELAWPRVAEQHQELYQEVAA